MIKIEKLTYWYSNKIQLFSGLNMELLPGKIYGLLGKNGAGKSTLIKNITGMLFPTTGTCQVFGKQPKYREVSFLKDIFFIPEECYLPRLTIRQLINNYSSYYPNFNIGQYLGYLAEFLIEPSRHLHSLSFGQRKKAIIGFALSANTRVLIMDEPTNGLDIPSKVTFRNMINDAFNEGRIIVISSHQVRDLDELITSLIIMDKGKVLLHEDREEILKKLYFKVSQAPQPTEKVLYQEKAANGWGIITENVSGQNSHPDIELLFNAAISDTNRSFLQMFQEESNLCF